MTGPSSGDSVGEGSTTWEEADEASRFLGYRFPDPNPGSRPDPPRNLRYQDEARVSR
jgi:hypothetical protein